MQQSTQKAYRGTQKAMSYRKRTNTMISLDISCQWSNFDTITTLYVRQAYLCIPLSPFGISHITLFNAQQKIHMTLLMEVFWSLSGNIQAKNLYPYMKDIFSRMNYREMLGPISRKYSIHQCYTHQNVLKLLLKDQLNKLNSNSMPC